MTNASLIVLPLMDALTGWFILSGGAFERMPNGSFISAMTNSSRDDSSSSPSTCLIFAFQVVWFLVLMASVSLTGMLWFPCSLMVICSSCLDDSGRRISA